MIALLTACFFFCNPYVRAELHQQERARKLCSATLSSESDILKDVRATCLIDPQQIYETNHK